MYSSAPLRFVALLSALGTCHARGQRLRLSLFFCSHGASRVCGVLLSEITPLPARQPHNSHTIYFLDGGLPLSASSDLERFAATLEQTVPARDLKAAQIPSTAALTGVHPELVLPQNVQHIGPVRGTKHCERFARFARATTSVTHRINSTCGTALRAVSFTAVRVGFLPCAAFLFSNEIAKLHVARCVLTGSATQRPWTRSYSMPG